MTPPSVLGAGTFQGSGPSYQLTASLFGILPSIRLLSCGRLAAYFTVDSIYLLGCSVLDQIAHRIPHRPECGRLDHVVVWELHLKHPIVKDFLWHTALHSALHRSMSSGFHKLVYFLYFDTE